MTHYLPSLWPKYVYIICQFSYDTWMPTRSDTVYWYKVCITRSDKMHFRREYPMIWHLSADTCIAYTRICILHSTQEFLKVQHYLTQDPTLSIWHKIWQHPLDNWSDTVQRHKMIHYPSDTRSNIIHPTQDPTLSTRHHPSTTRSNTMHLTPHPPKEHPRTDILHVAQRLPFDTKLDTIHSTQP